MLSNATRRAALRRRNGKLEPWTLMSKSFVLCPARLPRTRIVQSRMKANVQRSHAHGPPTFAGPAVWKKLHSRQIVFFRQS